MSVEGQAQTFSAWLVSLLPANPVAAAASGAMMPLILFTLLLALAIARSPEVSRETLTRFFRALSDAMLVLVRWIILAAPLGVFALVLDREYRSNAAALPRRGNRRPDSAAPLRACRPAATTHCLQLELVDRVVAGTR
jgi:Na+/serine symporter